MQMLPTAIFKLLHYVCPILTHLFQHFDWVLTNDVFQDRNRGLHVAEDERHHVHYKAGSNRKNEADN